jgi:hypothetical protein
MPPIKNPDSTKNRSTPHQPIANMLFGADHDDRPSGMLA